MRGLVGWLRYRDAVLDTLNAILLAYPRGRQFTGDFPELKSVIRVHFADGVSAQGSALQIAESIIANFTRQLSSPESAAALEALIVAGGRGFGELAERRVRGKREEIRDNAAFVIQLAGIALFMGGRLTQDGSLSRADRDGFLARIAATLGASAAQAKALSDAFIPEPSGDRRT